VARALPVRPYNLGNAAAAAAAAAAAGGSSAAAGGSCAAAARSAKGKDPEQQLKEKQASINVDCVSENPKRPGTYIRKTGGFNTVVEKMEQNAASAGRKFWDARDLVEVVNKMFNDEEGYTVQLMTGRVKTNLRPQTQDKVGRCGLTLSKLELKARLVSARETKI
jgi:hypothetical protein